MMKFILLNILIFSATLFASSFHIIDDATKAISTRIALVKSAKRSIYSSKFIFLNDKVGLSTLALMRSKARDMKERGIRPDIKLIIDPVGSINPKTFSGLPIEILLHLEEEGIEVKFYKDPFNVPLLIKHLLQGDTSFIFGRMHDKLLIVDGKRALSGGRNIQDSYYGVSDKNYVDRDVYTSGAAARSAKEHFRNMWDNKALTKIRFGYGSLTKCASYYYKNFGKKSKLDTLLECKEKLKAKGKDTLDKIAKEFAGNLKKYEVNVAEAVNELNQLSNNKEVRFISDTLDRHGKYVSRLSDELISLAKQAQRSLVIETPYLIPDENMMELFEYLLNKGVEITLVTNSLSSTDGLQAFAAYSLFRKKLVNIGPKDNKMKIYEYLGSHLGKYLHAKSATIDDKYALIGSYNLDPRSDRHNTEVMFVANDSQSTCELTHSIMSHIEYAQPIGANGNPYNGLKPYPKANEKKIKTINNYRKILKLPFIGEKLINQL